MAPYTGSITIERLRWSTFAMDIHTELTWRWHFVQSYVRASSAALLVDAYMLVCAGNNRYVSLKL
jgi:hypothetical protein